MTTDLDPLSDDAALLEAARGGDDAAFAVLYQRCYPAAVAFAQTLTTPTRAPDLVSEAVLKVYRLVKQGQGPTTSFQSYLCATVRSVFVDGLRQNGREVPVVDVEDLFDTSPDFADRLAETEAVARAYRSLPPRWQHVLWATAVEGRTPQELGREMGMVANSVAALAFRAKDGLRRAYLAQHVSSVSVDHRCQPFTPDLARYVRGSLAGPRARALREHLDVCTPCLVAANELDSLNGRLGAFLLPAVMATLVGPKLAPAALGSVGPVAAGARAEVLASTGSWVPGTAGLIIVAAGITALLTIGFTSGRVVPSAKVAAVPGAVGSQRTGINGFRPVPSPSPSPAQRAHSGALPTSSMEPHPQASGRTTPTSARTQSAAPAPTSTPSPALPPPSTPSPTPTGFGTSVVFAGVGTCTKPASAVVCTNAAGTGQPTLTFDPVRPGACSLTSPTVFSCSGPVSITRTTTSQKGTTTSTYPGGPAASCASAPNDSVECFWN